MTLDQVGGVTAVTNQTEAVRERVICPAPPTPPLHIKTAASQVGASLGGEGECPVFLGSVGFARASLAVGHPYSRYNTNFCAQSHYGSAKPQIQN